MLLKKINTFLVSRVISLHVNFKFKVKPWWVLLNTGNCLRVFIIKQWIYLTITLGPQNLPLSTKKEIQLIISVAVNVTTNITGITSESCFISKCIQFRRLTNRLRYINVNVLMAYMSWLCLTVVVNYKPNILKG